MNKYYYPAVLQQEDVGFSVWLPDIPGCVSQGDTLEEAIEMISEAADLYIDYSADNGQKLPKPSSPKDIKVENNQVVALIECDLLAYQKKHNNKAVKKTLSIPSWLNDIAENNHINFSSILQEALLEKLNIK